MEPLVVAGAAAAFNKAMSATIPAAYTRYLDEPLFGNLGTIRPDDTVQVNPMWFEFDGEFVRFTHTTKRAKYPQPAAQSVDEPVHLGSGRSL